MPLVAGDQINSSGRSTSCPMPVERPALSHVQQHRWFQPWSVAVEVDRNGPPRASPHAGTHRAWRGYNQAAPGHRANCEVKCGIEASAAEAEAATDRLFW